MKNKYGFTIIEILTVIAIIIILVGIGIPAYNSWRNRAQKAKAKAVIQQIEMALEMYKSDNGVYPNYSGNLNNGSLLTYLRGYVEFKQDDITKNILVDPWGRAYVVYVDNDGNPLTGQSDFQHNRNACYIYSYGPDQGNQDDDIDNYKPI